MPATLPKIPPMLAPSMISDPLQSPRWVVTNGETTVGPVHTELLLRGYLGGRIPEHCRVRELRWDAFRPLTAIRELGRLKRKLAGGEGPLGLREAVQRLPKTLELGELLSAALVLAASVLDASVGLVHRYRAPLSLPVTSTVLGASFERLGDVLPSGDPAYLLALRGKGLCGSPESGLAERLVAQRLQHEAPLAAVAMTPIRIHGRLVALLELGRSDHPFRVDDADDLAEFAAEIARRLD